MSTTTTTDIRTITCPDCDGRTTFRARPEQPCYTCLGTGSVTIDPQAIRIAVRVSRGRRTGTLRRSRPALPADGGTYGGAYVWRMIRFHAGLDMHLPIMAYDYAGISGLIKDSDRVILSLLDKLTDDIGIEHFGRARMYRAAARWGQALYGSQTPISPQQSTGDTPITFGQLADALGVAGIAGLDVGGLAESPEATAELILDADGRVDPETLATVLATPDRCEDSH